MISTFICQHCGRFSQRNPRVKNQKYCSSGVCQNALSPLTENEATIIRWYYGIGNKYPSSLGRIGEKFEQFPEKIVIYKTTKL